jgi:penicillin-binding protein 2
VAEFTTRAAYLASGKKARDHAWFAGYAPKDNPQIAWAVMVENGGFGSSAAAPIAQKLCKYWFFDRKENPLPPPVARTPSPFYALPGSAAGAAQ